MPPAEEFRGVSLGGWLVFEAFITPYLFAVTDCDISGEFYDIRIGDRNGQLSGGNRNTVKVGNNSTKHCMPLEQYPVDMWTLASAFPDKEMARSYFKRHWETWVTEQDVAKIAAAGLTHVKIPIGHWIRGDIHQGEPWIDGDWPYFARAVGWCRKYGLKVIADIHTAPGSQNGFDNSGRLLPQATAINWATNPNNVARSVKAIDDVSSAIKEEGLDDVISGIEILNEVYIDANTTTLKQFYNDTFQVVRSNLGESTTVIVSDNFDAGQFQGFWNDEEHKNTILDTHLYSIFSEKLRSMSPRQHIAFVCGNYGIQLMKCCWGEDKRSSGLGRIIGEWTASYDKLVAAEIVVVLDAIAETGVAPKFNRAISWKEQAMLRNYVEAQMIVYEGSDEGASNGWFFWNFKMQGGIFAEWDFLRGVDEGWIPRVHAKIPSRERFGDCNSIVLKTKDDYSVIDEFPVPSDLPQDLREDAIFDDDVVMTHGHSLERGKQEHEMRYAVALFGAAMLFYALLKGWGRRKKKQVYEPLPEVDVGVEAFQC